MIPSVAFPPKLRAAMYYLSVLVGLFLITAKSIFEESNLAETPLWYRVALQVLPVWLSAFGLTAASNTRVGDQPGPPPQPRDDHQAVGPNLDHEIHRYDPDRTDPEPERLLDRNFPEQDMGDTLPGHRFSPLPPREGE